MIRTLLYPKITKSLSFCLPLRFSTMLNSIAKPTMRVNPQIFTEGYEYDEIQKNKTFAIRSFLQEMLNCHFDSGVFLAYQRLIQTIGSQDESYLKEITGKELYQELQPQLKKFKAPQLSQNNCQDIIYTDIRFIYGDQKKSFNTCRLSFLEVLGIDIHMKDKDDVQELELSNCKMQIECYILSPYSFIDQDYDGESLYHRIILESKLIKQTRRPLTIFDLTLANPKRRQKIISDYFLGKKFEFVIKEIDSFIQ